MDTISWEHVVWLNCLIVLLLHHLKIALKVTSIIELIVLLMHNLLGRAIEVHFLSRCKVSYRLLHIVVVYDLGLALILPELV